MASFETELPRLASDTDSSLSVMRIIDDRSPIWRPRFFQHSRRGALCLRRSSRLSARQWPLSTPTSLPRSPHLALARLRYFSTRSQIHASKPDALPTTVKLYRILSTQSLIRNILIHFSLYDVGSCSKLMPFRYLAAAKRASLLAI